MCRQQQNENTMHLRSLSCARLLLGSRPGHERAGAQGSGQVSREQYPGLLHLATWIAEALRAACAVLACAWVLWAAGAFVATICDVAVMPKFQARGIGTKLIRNLVSDMRSRGPSSFAASCCAFITPLFLPRRYYSHNTLPSGKYDIAMHNRLISLGPIPRSWSLRSSFILIFNLELACIVLSCLPCSAPG